LLIIIGIAIISACTTEKNTLVTRTFHNTTSRFNIYFNGNESFKRGVKKVERAFVDDYSKILSIFNYVDIDIAQTIVPEMDRAINKASKVITFHSITVKPKQSKGSQNQRQREFYRKSEFNKWIDDSYILMGKAHFYKHDFDLAIGTFRYVINEYKDEPIQYLAYIWLARAYNEQGEYKESEKILSLLEGEREFPDRLKDELYITYADFYLKQGIYESSLPKLEQGIEHLKKKNDIIRSTFILAQVHDNVGNFSQSADLYGRVIKMNPPYEMTFNAKINRAGAYETGDENSKEIKEQLIKMLKDEKNIEYQDQIYYALGNIALKENSTSEAINNYKLSAGKSLTNFHQKGITYLALADIFYARPDYINAAAYYDSAVINLDSEYPGYQDLSNKNSSLTKLATNLNVITLEDSVQRIAQMNEGDRLKLIDDIIFRVRQEEIEKLNQESLRRDQINRSGLLNRSTRRFSENVGSEGSWYFYNTTAKNFGQAEFQARWGTRKLEDNWRRSNKSIVSLDDMNEDESEGILDEENSDLVTDNKSRDYYLQNVPLNDSMLIASHQKIKDALFITGEVYKNELFDFGQSINMFEDLNTRYPDNEYLLSCYYYLYELYREINNEARSEYYKNLIISKFPDSNYTGILTNPNYFKELEEQQNKSTNFYEETYNKYLNDQYYDVLENCDYAISNYKDVELLLKFKYLKVLSIGKTQDVKTFREALNELKNENPGDEITESIDNIFAQLNVMYPEIKEEEEAIIAEEIYTFNQNDAHLFVLILYRENIDVNQLVFNIVNFNLDNFSLLDLQISNESFDENNQILLIKDLENKEIGMEYYDLLMQNNEVLLDFDQNDYQGFIISSENYLTFIQDKSVSKYLKYFNNHYLNPENQDN